MRRDRQQSITLGIGIALSAGVFSIMPSVSAAPVLDHVVSGGAVVDQKTSPQVTDITSTTRNNVIDWKDFSVAQGETVRFDGGAKTNNYLNVVSGANTSQIDGAIKGGDNVYIVNPNGVVFGNSASIDVGSLYVSSRPLDAVNYDKVDANGDMQPLADTASMNGGDIVNMGTVQANSVFVEGGNIILADIDRIKTADGLDVNNNVTIQTEGKITLARNINTIVAEQEAQQLMGNKAATKNVTTNVFSFANTSDNEAMQGNSLGAGYTYTFNSVSSSATSINDTTGLTTLATTVNSGGSVDSEYLLTADLNFNNASYTPIGNESHPFTSHFDGGFHTVSGIKVSGAIYGGLFGYTSGATIENIGVSGGTVTSTASASSYVGGIVGYAVNTNLTNVFNEGTNIVANYDAESRGGGIVGKLYGGEINTAYNTGRINGYKDDVGGIIGEAQGTVNITHVYNTNEISNDGVANGRGIIARMNSDDDKVTLSDAYTTKGSLYSTADITFVNTPTNVIYTAPTSVYEADYTNKLSSISNKGGENTVWRIYEGQSLPLLRAFLTGHGTVTVNYNYTQGDEQGSNNGNDLTVIYNGNEIALSGISYTEGGSAFTPASGIITPPSDYTIDGDITSVNYNTSTNTVRTLAAFSTGQQGYDLVGNNYTINQRPVTLASSTITTNPYSREYDGTNDAKGAISSFTYGGANGILAADLTNGKVSIDTSGVTAEFVGSAGNTTDSDAPDVGGNKTIAVSGGVTITNGSGYYNYKLTGSAEFVDPNDPSKPYTFSGNSITQKAVTVSLNTATGINKEYDGETSVKGGSFVPSAQIASKIAGGIGTGDSAQTLTLTYADEANYVNVAGSPSKMAGTYDKHVKYSGIKISSVTSGSTKNYKLVNADGETIYSEVVDGLSSTGINVDAGGSLYGSGAISPKNISSQGFVSYDGSTAQTTRQYDMTSDYTKPEGKTVTSTETAAITDDLTFTVNTGGAKFIKTSTGTTVATADYAVNAGEANRIVYTVTVGGEDAANYTVDNVAITNGGTATLFGMGSITPRTINVAVDTTKSADKQYDASETVKVNDKISFDLTDGFLTDANVSAEHKLLNDGSKVVYTGVYTDTNGEGAANVNYSDTDGVLTKNITYTAHVQNADGSASTNYIFATTNATTATFEDGVGKITQREISNLYFKDVTKVYDTTADVNHNAIALNVGTGNNQVGLYGEDTPETVFDLTNVTGVYKAVAAGKNDADAENDKDVIYSGISGILKNNNYKLGSNIGSTATGKGSITQATLNDMSKLTFDVSGVTKVYDGDADIKGAGHTSTDNNSEAFIGTDGLVYTLNGNPVSLNYTVHDAYYDSAESNNATAQGITYELSVSGDSTGNYTIGSDLLTGGYLKWASTVDGWTDTEKAKMTGVITKKDLTVTALHDQVTKVYDGGTAVKDGTTTLVNDTAVSFDGWINVDGRTKTATANYTDKNVDSAAETAAGGKTVNYVITLDSTSQGNYTLKDAQGTTLTNNTLTGKGHITPATLTVTFTPNPVTKTYDGEKSFTGEVTPGYEGIVSNDKVGLKKFTIAGEERYYSAAEFDTADKGTDKDVYYTVELEGTDKGNYVLANSETVDNVTTMTGKGTISPKELSDSDIKISFADIISKVYDATDNVAFDHTGDGRYFDSELGNTISATAESYVNSLTVGGVTLTMGDNGDYKVYSAHYNSVGVGDNKKATYVFTLQGNKLDNFDMTHLSSTLYDQTNKRLTLATDSATNTINTTSVSITPKLLQASLNETVLDLDRTYNGTTNLPVSTEKAASKVTVTGFVNDNEDNTAFDDNLVNGRYVDRNVAYDADGNVTTKNVLFDVNLKGNGKENYVINDTNANSTTLTGENLGKITPKELAVDFVYTEKTYNNNPDAAVTGVTLIGLPTVDADAGLHLDTDAIEAQFGSKNGDTFTANGDVNYDESAEGKAGFKGVQYSNLQNAMKSDNGFGALTAGNYTIADTVYFDEAAKKGKIKRLALTMNDIEAGFKGDITKSYDGGSAVSNPEQYFSVHTKKEKTGGEEVEFKLLHDKDWANYVDQTGNTQVNVVQGNTLSYDNVVYEVKGLDADDVLHNFDITGLTEGSFSGTYTTKGNITPRVLKIDIQNPDNWVKVYDGGTSVKDASGVVQNTFAYDFVDDHDILEKDGSVNLVVTGAYENETANIEPDSTATTGKNIKYTLTLSGNTAGNYTLDSTNTTAGAATETDSASYTGNGAIKKRIVYAAFDEGVGTGIDRYYAGADDTSADADKTVRNNINLVASTGGDTGLLAGDTDDVSLNKDGIEANYASANVVRNPQTKKVTTQDVYFTNFNLQGNDSGNYVVKVNDANNPNTLVGKGTINPIKVKVGLKAVPKKEYDGTTDIEATYLANDNFTFTPDATIGSENVANDITITGAYKNANAGSKDANYADKEYTYSLTLNNDNYELRSGDDNGRTVTATNYGTKATLAGTDGIIEARTISLASIADMTKVYDGTTDADTGYMNNLEKNITFNNVVNNESLKLTGTAVYNDDANASDVETTAKPKKHQVKYTVNIGNTNYRLDDGTQYGTQDLTAYGDGYINRRTLSLVATPTSVNVGESMPAFTGTVTGFAGNEATLYSDFISYVKDNFKAADGANTSTPGSYGVYGWYMGNKTGLLGLNYQFDQAPANATAFTVNYVNNNTGNPDTKITPNNSIYHQISKDMNSGFGDNGAAAIEYKDKSGKVLGTEKIDSGEINSKGLMIGGGADMSKQADSNANIGIAGGDIVNMEGANAAGSVNIETNGEGTVVNLEVFSIDEEKESGTNNSTAEITNMDSQNGMASIEIRDEKQNMLGEDIEDKKEEKEGKIAIKSSNGEDDDEIELTVEKQGVNVA